MALVKHHGQSLMTFAPGSLGPGKPQSRNFISQHSALICFDDPVRGRRPHTFAWQGRSATLRRKLSLEEALATAMTDLEYLFGQWPVAGQREFPSNVLVYLSEGVGVCKIERGQVFLGAGGEPIRCPHDGGFLLDHYQETPFYKFKRLDSATPDVLQYEGPRNMHQLL